ncbi:hypothetical protein [Burkholderia vietnamiensis]|uniref:hypothetical protein n=1 Tax=Burkholderia vietnamiensis TaxID=60552 RepID=UPI000053830B|nr:hypothetical protein [Burkholderia vietnamiensis]MCA8288137.1 hypothetical protein [Burkholderia vietnamiensis]MCB4343099.1 hypothetical protein [Burkholderia vietnamiensis]MDN7820321.1 hypothetical protein [Burkholderia vietnamiensis]
MNGIRTRKVEHKYWRGPPQQVADAREVEAPGAARASDRVGQNRRFVEYQHDCIDGAGGAMAADLRQPHIVDPTVGLDLRTQQHCVVGKEPSLLVEFGRKPPDGRGVASNEEPRQTIAPAQAVTRTQNLGQVCQSASVFVGGLDQRIGLPYTGPARKSAVCGTMAHTPAHDYTDEHQKRNGQQHQPRKSLGISGIDPAQFHEEPYAQSCKCGR